MHPGRSEISGLNVKDYFDIGDNILWRDEFQEVKEIEFSRFFMECFRPIRSDIINWNPIS